MLPICLQSTNDKMIQEIFFETLKIILIVTFLMIIVEWMQIKFKGKIKKYLTRNEKNQIIGSSLLGAVPGCVDAFFIVSLYAHGLVGFGALAAVMLATAGDEAFVMLAMIPETALLIFGTCMVFGIAGGFLADKIAKKIKLKRAKPCVIKRHAKEEETRFLGRHFFKEHVWQHVIKKHIPKLFLWIFFALLAVEFLTQYFDLAAIMPQNVLFMVILAALIGIIPESGPHLIFLTLFAQGLIPFSVLMTSSLVQDGHGLLPMLSYSVRDTIHVKAFNVGFGLLVGLILFLIGI